MPQQFNVIKAAIEEELRAQRFKLFVISVMGQIGGGKTSFVNALFKLVLYGLNPVV